MVNPTFFSSVPSQHCLFSDPYYFLRFDLGYDIDPSDERFLEKFAASFIPSFLSMDVDGRVLRVDSFSKTVAPGMRLGTVTCSPLFHRYIIQLTDNSTQQPAGFSQLLITEMLGEGGWTLSGYAKWVKCLAQDYEMRRNFFLDVFESKVAPTGYASVYKPQAGMFIWIKVHFEKHPRYIVRNNGKGNPRTNCMDLIQEVCISIDPGLLSSVLTLVLQLFVKCMDNGLAIMPAPIFLVTDDPKATAGLGGDDHLLDVCHLRLKFTFLPLTSIQRVNFLRATFAGTEETMAGGLTILGETLIQFFNE